MHRFFIPPEWIKNKKVTGCKNNDKENNTKGNKKYVEEFFHSYNYNSLSVKDCYIFMGIVTILL